MGRIFDGIKKFLESHFETKGFDRDDDGDPTLAFQLEDDNGNEWGCLAIAEEEAEQLMFYSVHLENTPAEQMSEVMEFITRANYGLQVGNFELDLSDGEVRYKTSIDVERVILTEQLCANLVELNLMLMGLYYDGLTSVMKGKATAVEAIATIEDDGSDDDDDDDE